MSQSVRFALVMFLCVPFIFLAENSISNEAPQHVLLDIGQSKCHLIFVCCWLSVSLKTQRKITSFNLPSPKIVQFSFETTENRNAQFVTLERLLSVVLRRTFTVSRPGLHLIYRTIFAEVFLSFVPTFLRCDTVTLFKFNYRI